jgi:tRNA modification GTPase
MSDPTRFFWLTPPGRGAIATVCIVGSRAVEQVAGLFRAASGVPLPELPLRQIALGRWALGDESPAAGEPPADQSAEEVVLCRVDQDVLEVHCHGGDAVAPRISASLERAGCLSQPWHAWTRWAAPDPLAAEAWQALADARTERTALLLLAQFHGALRAAVDDALQALSDSRPALALQRIDQVLQWRDVGLHLTVPWRVVLAGPPNVGKSSLLNRLLGWQRAIVYDQPGTTRDLLTATTAIDGWPVVLIDTAGLRASGDPLEEAGVARARQASRQADLLVLVFDRTEPWTARESALRAEYPDALLVHNKSDLRAAEGDRPEGIVTSAVTGHGLDALLQAIARRLVPCAPPVTAPLAFTPRQVGLLDAARQALCAADESAAERALRALWGAAPCEAAPPAHSPAS